MIDADRRVFVYKPARNAVFLAVALGLVAFLLPAALFDHELFAFVFVLGFIGLASFDSFRRSRPIAIGEERIEALLWGHPWRTIEWRDVDRIERRAVRPEPDGGGVFASPGYDLILIRSHRRSITIVSDILEFEALKRRLTEKAKRRGIEIVSVEPQPLGHAPHITRLDEL